MSKSKKKFNPLALGALVLALGCAISYIVMLCVCELVNITYTLTIFGVSTETTTTFEAGVVLFGQTSESGETIFSPAPMALVSWTLMLVGAVLVLGAGCCFKKPKFMKLLACLGGVLLLVGGILSFFVPMNMCAANLENLEGSIGSLTFTGSPTTPLIVCDVLAIAGGLLGVCGAAMAEK